MIESAREPRLGLESRVSKPTISRLIAPSIGRPAPVLPSRSTVCTELSMVLSSNGTAIIAPPPAKTRRAPTPTANLVHSGLRRFFLDGTDGAPGRPPGAAPGCRGRGGGGSGGSLPGLGGFVGLP